MGRQWERHHCHGQADVYDHDGDDWLYKVGNHKDRWKKKRLEEDFNVSIAIVECNIPEGSFSLSMYKSTSYIYLVVFNLNKVNI